METLKEKLMNFKATKDDETKLAQSFKELAKWFLYGGYIKVEERYRIYIHAVEFYFHCEDVHCEDGTPDNIEDPIVYHRNNHKDFKGTKPPYFPLMTLHAHDSGYDITFENEKEKYRASVLIREYIVCDNEGRLLSPGGNCGEKGKRYDNRSTFLKRYLNGFSIEEGKSYITWKDEKEEEYFDKENNINISKRKGVKEHGEREWKFQRHFYPKFIKS